jgi:hypothetical protein
LSFFDEATEQRTQRQRPSRPRPSAPSRRRRGGGGGPPQDRQVVRRRQALAIGVAVIVLIVLILGIKSCSDSARKRHLRDYNASVTAVAQKSDNNVSKPLFALLSRAGSGNPGRSVDLQNQINGLKLEADQQLKRAQALGVPSQANTAQRYVLQSLEFRRDGVAMIAKLLQPALSQTDNGAATRRIAGEMRAFDASDVIWSQRVVPYLRNALTAGGVPVGAGGETVARSEFLRDLAWLDPTYVATRLGSASGTSGGKATPGSHGHALLSTSVGSTTLSTSATNQIPVNPAPTFQLQIQNQGQNNEANVRVRVEVTGAGSPDVATKTIRTTTAGQTSTATLSLPTTPPTGSVTTVKATVLPVPGEGTTSNNTSSYPVLFTK